MALRTTNRLETMCTLHVPRYHKKRNFCPIYSFTKAKFSFQSDWGNAWFFFLFGKVSPPLVIPCARGRWILLLVMIVLTNVVHQTFSLPPNISPQHYACKLALLSVSSRFLRYCRWQFIPLTSLCHLSLVTCRGWFSTDEWCSHNRYLLELLLSLWTIVMIAFISLIYWQTFSIVLELSELLTQASIVPGNITVSLDSS